MSNPCWCWTKTLLTLYTHFLLLVWKKLIFFVDEKNITGSGENKSKHLLFRNIL